MEAPVDVDGDSVRDEKVKLLRQIAPIKLQDVVLGQYEGPADGSEPGYLEDETVPEGSSCPTFASALLSLQYPYEQGPSFDVAHADAV